MGQRLPTKEPLSAAGTATSTEVKASKLRTTITNPTSDFAGKLQYRDILGSFVDYPNLTFSNTTEPRQTDFLDDTDCRFVCTAGSGEVELMPVARDGAY